MDDRRKTYRAWDAQQNCHESISPRDALPEDDLGFFLLDLIPQIDLTPFHKYYAQEMRGQPPFDVIMMVTLFVYAYAVGIRSSRKIAAASTSVTTQRSLVVYAATPMILWPAPAAITCGVALSSARLDATTFYNGKTVRAPSTTGRLWAGY